MPLEDFHAHGSLLSKDLLAHAVCGDLDDEGVTEYDRSEGQGQTSKHATQAPAPKQMAGSQKV